MDQHERKLIAIVRKFVIWYLILGELLMHYIHYTSIFSDEKKIYQETNVQSPSSKADTKIDCYYTITLSNITPSVFAHRWL